MPITSHTILGGKVRLYRRGDGEHWHCATYFQGKEHRKSTKEDSLPHAEERAEDWYLELRGKGRAGLLGPGGKPFKQAAEAFVEDYEASTAGERSSKWVEEHKAHVRNHLLPYFQKYTIPQIDPDKAQEYRIHRINNPFIRKPEDKRTEDDAPPKPTSRKTIENEIITLRMILKFCVRKGWLKAVPDLSSPYRKQKKIITRPWFSPEEYTKLRKATAAYAKSPLRERYRWDAEQLHDLVLFLSNTGLRPDEAKNLEHRDVSMVKDRSTGDLILEIDVRGKTGFGYCKSRPDAVKPYQRLLNRPKWQPTGRKPRNKAAIAAAEKAKPPAAILPKPTDKVFPGNHIKLFNKILAHNDLKFNREKQPLVLYSLRHYYICQRLMEGADIYQVAKNCRTSVEIIQKYYASHIKNMIDASAVNTRRLKRGRSTENVRVE